MKQAISLLDWVTKAMMVVTAFCAFAIAFFILVEIVSRQLGIRFYGTAEYIRNMLILIVFLQLPYAVRVRGMLSVDIFVGGMPLRVKHAVDSIGSILGVVFFGAVAVGAFGPAVDAWVYNQYEGEGVVDVPAWPARFSIVIGCTIAVIYYLARIGDSLTTSHSSAEKRQ